MTENTTSTQDPNAQLAAAMAKVLASVHAIGKSGRNDFHGYDYATESDITNAVRRLLGEHGIALFPSVKEVDVKEVKNARGKTTKLTTVTLQITLAHSSGGTMVVEWRGQGEDSGDKGYYKAYTGAMKYFLLKTFLISTGDDPEATDSDGAPTFSLRAQLDRFDALVSEVVGESQAAAFRAAIAPPSGQLYTLDDVTLDAFCAKLEKAEPRARREMILRKIGQWDERQGAEEVEG